MKLGQSGITRLLREGSMICGLNYKGTFNDMRYVLAGLLYEMNFSGDQIRARLGQSSKQAHEKYINKAQQNVDWKKTQAALESLSHHKYESIQMQQGQYAINPATMEREYVSTDIPVPKDFPGLTDEKKDDQHFGHRSRHLQPNPLRELQLNTSDLFDSTPTTDNRNPNHPPTAQQSEEFNKWTNKHGVRKDAVKFGDQHEEEQYLENDTEFLFHKYSDNELDYNKQTQSQPYIVNKEFDDPFVQTQIMDDIAHNASENAQYPDVGSSQTKPGDEKENDSTTAVFDGDDEILTPTQMSEIIDID